MLMYNHIWVFLTCSDVDPGVLSSRSVVIMSFESSLFSILLSPSDVLFLGSSLLEA